MVKIKIRSNDQILKGANGDNLYQILINHGLEINAYCSGNGTCGKCKVEILEGKVSGENLGDNFYLACKSEVVEDLLIDIPTIKDSGGRKDFITPEFLDDINSGIIKYFLRIPEPSLSDQQADWERLKKLLPTKFDWLPSIEILNILPEILRKADFALTVVAQEGFVISIEEGDTRNLKFGLAFDIGTTSIAASLVNLHNGRVLATTSLANRQQIVGADVISRIQYVGNHSDGSKFLQSKVIETLNQLIEQLEEITGINRKYIYSSTIVGNTTMQHLLLGFNPSNLAKSPFVPVTTSEFFLTSKGIGLNLNCNSIVHVMPNLAGFVGSDTLGVILSTGIFRSDELRLAIDIGTNGEIILGSNKGILVTSTAAGPAFEGAQISCGMRAARGAIERVSFAKTEINLKIIDDSPIIEGICGSGLIQAVAEMLKLGLIDQSGRLIDAKDALQNLSPYLANRIRKINDINSFILVEENIVTGQREIYLTQNDIRELQLAKGAIAAGINILMKELEVSLNDIHEVLIAGVFGSFIDKESARDIGLIPPVCLNKIKAVGNAAGSGAFMSLLSVNLRQEVKLIINAVKNIELSIHPDFEKVFLNSLVF